MRTLLVILTLCPTIVHAGWMSESDIGRANTGQGGTTNYMSRSKCEARAPSGESCFSIYGKDLNRQSVQMVREGAWQGAEQSEPCDDQQDCETKLSSKLCATPDHRAFWGDVDENGSLETWCSMRAMVKRLKPDSRLGQSDDARKADLALKREKIVQLQSSVMACAKMDALSATTGDVARCVQSVAKQLVRFQLSLSEL